MSTIDRYGYVLCRLCIASIFVSSLISKFTGFSMTLQFMASYGFPLPFFFLIIAIIIEFTGVLSLISGYQIKNVSRMLLCFVFATTFIFHTNLPDETQRFMFFKNIAIMGGLTVLAIHGAGVIKKEEMSNLEKRGYLLARIAIAALFVVAAMGKLIGFEALQEMLLEFDIPQTGLVLMVSIAVELACSALIVWGYKTRYAALLLIIYLIPVTLILHTNLGDVVQKIMFFKNVAVMGCLGLLAIYEGE